MAFRTTTTSISSLSGATCCRGAYGFLLNSSVFLERNVVFQSMALSDEVTCTNLVDLSVPTKREPGNFDLAMHDPDYIGFKADMKGMVWFLYGHEEILPACYCSESLALLT
ncbi:hypothetical protein ASPBRDRAFT_516468 [Aspergillus brasiliensis CBS 101740]|uniref:Uncharacterized protein n=1 Tax=Aspergillus brasiliensis (strain CBS 101740 / IMI 381727 / IBT 21946) TaxID=767769 RepID=A0A1L9UQ26_ASPBC|nr:hypothetical protein ASPBRDRAFT_516468 [Aspergillus brasiliensis CBS 101740]